MPACLPGRSVRLRGGATAGATCAAACALSACAPALDWREARLPGAGLVATFPCRPVAQERRVPLAGQEVTLVLHACEAAGTTFAVGLADVGDPRRVGPVLQALRTASVDKLGAPGAASESAAASGSAAGMPWSVPGATPQAQAVRMQWSGAPGQPAGWRMQTALFGRGTWVVQATWLGTLPAAQADPFFDGLRFTP
ncbi:hypothetical protein [Ideonella sp.]|uniref:hypothetical protein n=1 Tax=Ideonella sp. TaxID=1929293 RepID=UPI0035B29E24